MKKIRNRVFAAVLAALMLVTAMPVTALYASAEAGDIPGNTIEQAEAENTEYTKKAVTDETEEAKAGGSADKQETGVGAAAEKSGTGAGAAAEESELDAGAATEGTDAGAAAEGPGPETDAGAAAEEPVQEPPAGTPEEDTAQCDCETLCTEDSINSSCPLCGADSAAISGCAGKKTENSFGEDTEEAGAGETESPKPEDAADGLCVHHKEHDGTCGYKPASEDGEGSACAYECRICPIENLIAALPAQVTEDNADKVRAQLDEILDLYRELTGEEQEQIDLSHCLELQEALDAANAPMTAEGRAEGDEASVTAGGQTLYYATLEEAFEAANGKTAVITMLADAECTRDSNSGAPLNIAGGSITLDMNGKTLSGKGIGYYGIVDVSGGSLRVQGEGIVNVSVMGLSCRGGTLTVDGITMEMVGSGNFCACSGVDNQGGTVILNGVQMTGPASDGQISHRAGSTTLRDVTAAGTTEQLPDSVYYYGKGTLQINGGTFDKVTVDADNNGGVQSVAKLLGEGYICRKQDGAWATDDELEALEISNVTVEKIPFTIEPRGDTSWHFGSQEIHTLAMNARAVVPGKEITYVWRDGDRTLDCAEDVYTVPTGMSAGNYTYTCEATCDGYTRSHDFAFTLEMCAHTGITFKPCGDGFRHEGTCMECGAEIPPAGHTCGPDGICTGCGVSLAAKMNKDGSILYFDTDHFAGAFAAENSGATVTLLRDVDLGADYFNYLSIPNGTDFTLDCGAFTLSSSSLLYTVWLSGGSSLTFVGGTIRNTGSGRTIECSTAAGTTFTMLGGTLDSAANYALDSAYRTRITGGTIGGGGLLINSSTDSVELGGGTYAGIVDQRNTSESSENRPLSAILADGCAARGPDGLIRCDTADQELAGPITVEKCQYTDISVQESGDGKHGLFCPYCGYRYEHLTTLTAAADGNIVTLSGGCKDCDYKAALATASFTLPKVTYGQPGEVACTWDAPAGYYVMVWIDNGQSAQSEFPEWSWSLEEFFGSTKVTAGRHVLKVSFFNASNVEPSNVCELDFTIDPAPLTADMVTLDKTEVPYNGQEQKPVITVLQGNGTELTEGTDYKVSCTRGGEVTTDFTNAGTITVTITGVDNGNYAGTVTKEYTISKADVPESALTCTPPADPFYTGQSKTAVVTVADKLAGIGEITVKYKKDNAGSLLAEAKEPGTFHVYAVITGGTNYKEAEIEMDSFTISYMDAPKLLYNKNSAQKDYYSGDVTVAAVPADNHTYTVSDAIDGGYEESFTISAQQGSATKTLHFKDEAGHISDGVPVTVNFDLTPPTGEIAVGAKWWQNFLHFVSFGHYAVKEYTVSIKTKDAGGSGIDNDRTEYVIVTGSGQYTDADALAAAALNWAAYDDNARPAVPVNSSPYVVYARLTDKAGNVTYISTGGILLDSTAPTVGGLTVPEEAIRDVTANVTFTVDEAADYYYVVLPEDSAAPSAEDIILTCGGTLPEGRTGTAIAGTVPKGSGAVSGDTLPASVSVDVKNLSPGTAYTVYVTAVDRALDIEKEKDGVPAGNITKVTEETKAAFITKKTLPVITKFPTVTGTYGQSLGEMTVAGGAAQGGNTVLTGTWTVGGTDKDRKPDAGTAEKVTVVFTPDNAGYDSISAEVSLKVVPRNLNAAGVTVSEAAGSYTYDNGAEIRPAVAVNAGTPTSGIFIFDNEAELTADDFTVSYINNRNAGTASVTITGKGNYTGSVTKGFTIGKAPGREVPDLGGNMTVDNETETYTYTITPTGGAVYRMGDDGRWTAPGETAGNVFKGITPGTRVTFYAKLPETENYKEGTTKNIMVDFPKLTPAAPALSYTRETDETTGEIALTIAEAAGAQYSFDGGTNWQDAREKGGFDASQTVTLAVRLKETDTHNPSPAQIVTVNLAKEDRKAPSAFTLSVTANGETDYTVTIPASEGCEYSFDGETWSDVNRKTGVRVGETVTGYKRYRETDDYNAGSAVSAKATMPKFTVKTPVISPAGGSYSGSISVTITCGSPGAEIYYTTDGSTPGRSSTRYTGAFTVSAPATVKAAAIKDGLNDSTVAAVSYTKQSGGSGGDNGNISAGDYSGGNDSGGSSSGNGGSGDDGQDNGEGSGQNNSAANGQNGSKGGNMAPVMPASSPAADAKPGTGAAKPGNGNAGIPFLKGEDGKTGWDVIRAEEELAEEGSVINVDMNGTTVVPGNIFDSIRGKDITITFDMGNGIFWSVDGKSITRDISRNRADGIDFSVKTGTNAIPADIVNSCFADSAAGERYSIQLSLAHEGEFGFTAVLFINCGKENAGYTASLYYYRENTGELEFICADTVAEDGTVSLVFTHASDYVIAIEGDKEEESGSATEPAQPETPAGTDGSAGDVPESSAAGQEKKNALWPIVAGILALAGIAFAGALAWKKKGENGSTKEDGK